MKIAKDQIVDDNNLVGHLVLNGIASHKDICKEIVQKGEAVLCFTVNGREIDIQSFVDHWQSQVNKAIKVEAAKLVEEKFNNVRNSLENYSQELTKALEDLN